MEAARRFAVEIYHVHNIDNRAVFEVPGLHTEHAGIFKLKKFACRALKGKGARSGIRVIYAWHAGESRAEFIEIYYKGRKKDMDYARVKM